MCGQSSDPLPPRNEEREKKPTPAFDSQSQKVDVQLYTTSKLETLLKISDFFLKTVYIYSETQSILYENKKKEII